MSKKVSTNARNEQTVQFHDEVSSYITDCTPSTENLMYAKYTQNCVNLGNNLKSAYMLSVEKSKTQELDKKCDKSFMAIGNTLMGLSMLEDATLKAAAMALYGIWTDFGGETTRKDLESEITEYKKLIHIFQKPENQEKLALFSVLNMLVNQFSAQIIELENHKKDYESKITIHRNALTTSEAKDIYINYFNGPFRSFMDFWTMEDPDTYEELNSKIQGSINRINEVVKLRQTLAEQNKELTSEETKQEDQVTE